MAHPHIAWIFRGDRKTNSASAMKLRYKFAFAAIILCIIAILTFRKNGAKSTELDNAGRFSIASHTPEGQSEAKLTPITSSQSLSKPLLNSKLRENVLVAAKSLAINSQMLASWQVPIEFYGKIVDEKSNAVAGATIELRWPETPSPDGNRIKIVQSDKYGTFFLTGEHGPSLDISITKAGYYWSSGDTKMFKYGMFADKMFVPNRETPVVFHLHKVGEPQPLFEAEFPTAIGRIAQLRMNGTPLILSVNSVQLKLEFWKGNVNEARLYDWSVQVSLPNGEIQAASDELPLEAPESGYQSSVSIHMLATDSNWRGEAQSKFYVHLNDGTYGYVDLHLLARNGVFTVRSAINPTGSRNLESQH
jgi:hypothetical protein